MVNRCGIVETVITRETFASIAATGAVSRVEGAPGPPVFVLPQWMRAWWQVFGGGRELQLLSIRRGGRLLGVAPLYTEGGAAFFVGGADVCDYLDFIIAPGAEGDFTEALLNYLKEQGVTGLELVSVRPDSAACAGLAALAGVRPLQWQCFPETVSRELDLPDSWEGYLALLNKKQRHEVRRKLRRLESAGECRYRVLEEAAAVTGFFPQFLELFKLNREKANFMTEPMERFFRGAVESMSPGGLLKFGVLELDGRLAAAVLYFDYGGGIYLYNSAYDPAYASLSAGLLCKVLSLKDALEKGRRRYDFLKGDEPYKQRLGGREVPIYTCRVDLRD